jgi:heat shock protein HtpX
MIIFFDPLFFITMIGGYILMILLASAIAPKISSKIASRLTLFSSMLLLSLLIIFSFSFILFIISYFLHFSYEILTDLILTVIILNLITYIFSPILIKNFYVVKEDKEIQKIVDEVKNKLGYKGKLIGAISNLPFPNAFAFGNFIFGKYVAVTSSLKRIASKEELKAVIGHEIGHHLHKDYFVMLFFGLLPSIIYYLGYYLIIARDRKGNYALLGIFAIIFSFILQILVLAFSRLREYFADYEGARASSKEAMQSSLVRLYEFYKRNPLKNLGEKDFGKTLFIYAFLPLVNPLVEKETIEKIKNVKVSSIEEILSTHPPIPKRLKFLDNIRL